MSKNDAIRALKDEKYRLSLSEEERANLPTNPVGLVELSDVDLMSVIGGAEIDQPGDGGGCTCTCCTCCCCC